MDKVYVKDLLNNFTQILFQNENAIVWEEAEYVGASTPFESSSIMINKNQSFSISTKEIATNVRELNPEILIRYDGTTINVDNKSGVSTFSVASTTVKATSPYTDTTFIELNDPHYYYLNSQFVEYYTAGGLILDEGMAVACQRYGRGTYNIVLDPVSATVDYATRSILIDSISTNVRSKQSVFMNTLMNPVSIVVARNTAIKPEPLAGGAGLTALNMVLQVQAYYNIELKFPDKYVKDVTGLPQGLAFYPVEKCIKGAPERAGDYPINIVFENDTIMKGLFKVPVLKRQK